MIRQMMCFFRFYFYLIYHSTFVMCPCFSHASFPHTLIVLVIFSLFLTTQAGLSLVGGFLSSLIPAGMSADQQARRGTAAAGARPPAAPGGFGEGFGGGFGGDFGGAGGFNGGGQGAPGWGAPAAAAPPSEEAIATLTVRKCTPYRMFRSSRITNFNRVLH